MMMDPADRDLPPLLLTDSAEGAGFVQHASFHESSTNVSIADSAAATQGSESFRDFVSDREQMSGGGFSSSSSDDDSDEDSFVESSSEKQPPSSKSGFHESLLSSDEDWVEDPSENDHDVSCLFCAEVVSNVHSLLTHCERVHQFHLPVLKKRHGMDQYSFIRLINFIRSCSASSREVMDLETPIWEQDKFMLPVIDDDPLLMYDFDGEVGLVQNIPVSTEIKLEMASDPAGDDQRPAFGMFRVANAEEGHITLSQAHFDDLHAALERMQLCVDEANATMKQYQEDMESMRKAMRHLVLGDKQSKEEEEAVSKTRYDDDDDEEDSYFSGYAHFSIHHEMLSDKRRTECYQRAIIGNSHMIKDKVVLDLGCGTGILSMFAVQAGAGKVLGVDQSQIIFNAMAIIRENKMENKIKLVRGKIEEVSLCEPLVDVLVSEWMGYFLLFEGMLDSVIHARNKYLSPSGIILPNACSIYMMAVGDSERYADVVEFWDDIYGLKMSSMRPEVLREASIETVPPEKTLSEPALVLHLDLKTCTSQETEFFSAFQLTMKRTDMLTALVGFFDVDFNLDKHVKLSTSPFHPSTHWKQTVFYLPQPVKVTAGKTIDCSIQVRRHCRESRWLEVTLTVDSDKLKYTLS